MLFLAGDAITSPRNCLEAFEADGITAICAITELADANAVKCTLNQAQPVPILAQLSNNGTFEGVIRRGVTRRRLGQITDRALGLLNGLL
jgi:hypothetical protein